MSVATHVIRFLSQQAIIRVEDQYTRGNPMKKIAVDLDSDGKVDFCSQQWGTGEHLFFIKGTPSNHPLLVNSVELMLKQLRRLYIAAGIDLYHYLPYQTIFSETGARAIILDHTDRGGFEDPLPVEPLYDEDTYDICEEANLHASGLRWGCADSEGLFAVSHQYVERPYDAGWGLDEYKQWAENALEDAQSMIYPSYNEVGIATLAMQNEIDNIENEKFECNHISYDNIFMLEGSYLHSSEYMLYGYNQNYPDATEDRFEIRAFVEDYGYSFVVFSSSTPEYQQLEQAYRDGYIECHYPTIISVGWQR